IHSFCFDLIREHAENLGISPQFAIAEPSQERIYQQHAMQTVMERYSSRPEMETLFSRFCARDDSELEGVVLEIADYLDTLPFRKDWIRRAIAASQDSDALFRLHMDSCCDALNRLIDFIRLGEDLAERTVPGKPENRYKAKLERDIAELTGQRDYLHRAEQSDVLAAPEKSVVKLVTFPRDVKAEPADEALRMVCKQFCDLYKERYNSFKSLLTPLRYFTEDVEAQKTLIPLLLSLTEDYLDALFEEKRSRNVLCFSDAEELALSLLGTVDEDGNLHRTELATFLSERISLLMVDEYQDSNNKQDCLFKLLSKDCRMDADGLHYGSNAFLVGDVKQSIYSFRQANPENFRRAIAESTPLADCTAQEMALIRLNQNFRSSRDVLHFVNSLFHALMTVRCGDVDYTEDEQLNFGCPSYEGADAIPTVLLLPQPKALPEDTDMQAECIADTIQKMLQDKTPVLLGEGQQRPCEPKDFCILVRSVKKHGAALCEALERRGLPVMTDRESGLLSLPEICLIRNLLRITDNPMTDAAMAAVLLSPVCGFTAETLADLKVYGKRRRLFLQMQAISRMEELPPKLRKLQAGCNAFLTLLAEMREAADRLPLEECIREICEMTDLYSLQSIYKDGDIRRSDLDAFMQAAQRYRETTDLSSQGSLGGWLRYLDRLEEAGQDIEIKDAAAERSCIFVKTIHKSKGLEYPFVFVAHPEHEFNLRDDVILADEAGQIGLLMLDHETFQKASSITRQYLSHGIRKRKISEELRLFYVALTRARQQLFLVTGDIHTGAVKSTTSLCNLGPLLEEVPALAPVLAEDAGCMQDWILMFLFGSPDAERMIQAMDNGKCSKTKLAEYRVWTQDMALSCSEETETVQALPAEESVLVRMQAQIAFTYTSPETELVSKYSVTQLAHPEAAASDLAHTPRLAAMQTTALTGAAKGTAVHKSMQYMEFAKAAADPASELERLCKAGYLTEAEAQAVPVEQITAFFQSPLYERITASSEVLRERQLFVRIGELSLPADSRLIAQYGGTDGVLIGTMDLLFREGDGYVLVDYKTDYVRNAETLLQEYSLQLGLYQKAAELMFGVPVREAYIYSFTLGKEIRVPLSEIRY
ncbi:MAG: UvrD-helicase domain-containing protein, partial [Oscillospiraceae bacterium]|nr:UvrD-helicase domain-containing protein [Oscillospiraceae bacterium]